MLQRISSAALALAITVTLAAGPLARPAAASTGSTWTTIEAAAAVIGGIVLYNNYKHKRQAANTIVGYTRNGGRVYGDGRIVMPNGSTVYPNSRGQYPWGQAAYYRPDASGYTYGYARDRDDYRAHWNNGRHRARGHHRAHHDRD